MRIAVAGRFLGDQPGATTAVLQYAAGFELLGHEVLLLEEQRSTPAVTRQLAHVGAGRSFGGDAVVVHAVGEATGMAWKVLEAWLSAADLLVNLGGALRMPALVELPRRALYVDVDPGFTQLWSAVHGIDMGFAGHDRFASFGTIGSHGCRLPDCGIEWIATLPPVVLEHWPFADRPPERGLTTVANWRSYGSFAHGGAHYGQKAHAFRELIALPQRLPDVAFEPALAIDPAERRDVAALRRHGWRLHDPTRVIADGCAYHRFVAGSTAELGVAKTGYVAARCGWFSDRSACYLASGRPVLASDTGWPARLPDGLGLLSFSSADDVVEALAVVRSDYDRHRRAAREVAEEHLDARRVLTRLLEEVDA